MSQESTPAFERLEDQIAWYNAKSIANGRRFKLLKAWTIAVAALVPVLASFGIESRTLAILTATIAIVEALQQLQQYQANWILYRSTCEALKHEKYLYLSTAGPYRQLPDPDRELAERVEGLVSQEHAKWTFTRSDKQRQDAAKAPA